VAAASSRTPSGEPKNDETRSSSAWVMSGATPSPSFARMAANSSSTSSANFGPSALTSTLMRAFQMLSRRPYSL